MSICHDWLLKEMVNDGKYKGVTEMIRIGAKEINRSIRNLEKAWADINRGKTIKGNELDVDPEILEENLKLAKKAQQFADRNRIERKAFREQARCDNSLSELSQRLEEVFIQRNLSLFTVKHPAGKDKCAGIVQLADLHFNELVHLADNTYDAATASKRLRKYVRRVKKHLIADGVKNVVLALTGDLMNSDRRLDELLAQTSNRSLATFTAVDLLQQVILDLNKDFNLTVTYVSGNESRVKDEWGWTDILATDNYDTMIFFILRLLFKGSRGIRFISTDPIEQVIEIAGQHILLMHGNSLKSGNSDLEKSISQIIGKYSLKGIQIRYIIFGHLHSSRIGDTYARSSSLVGNNAYSDRGLQLTGRAGQNLFIVHSDGSIDGMKIDLQSTEDEPGYECDNTLDMYNAKSADRLKREIEVLRVVV